MAITWAEVLDLYGRALVEFDDALDESTSAHDDFEFELPDGLGPIPPELEPAATAVAEKSARIEQRVRDAMAVTAQQQAAVTRARASTTRRRRQANLTDKQA